MSLLPVWPVLYQGDGSLVDHGALTKGDRFVIDLGPCRLGSDDSRAYEMRRLPPRRLVVGISIDGAFPNRVGVVQEEQRLTSYVGLTITNERDQIVISEHHPLNEWVWSLRGPPPVTFLWVRGKIDKHDLGKGWYQEEQVGMGADHGWGTCFRPRFRGRYLLNLNVSQADHRAAMLAASVRVTGGGL